MICRIVKCLALTTQNHNGTRLFLSQVYDHPPRNGIKNLKFNLKCTNKLSKFYKGKEKTKNINHIY